MDANTAWTLILLLSVISFATRAWFLLLFARLTLPRGMQQGLRFVPAAVFTALLAPDILARSGSIELGLSNPEASAALVAGLVAWKTRNTLATILAGMIALHLLRQLILG